MTNAYTLPDTTPRVYFVKRHGLLTYSVWWRYADDRPDPYSDATEWRASPIFYRRAVTAQRAAQDLWATHNHGRYIGWHIHKEDLPREE